MTADFPKILKNDQLIEGSKYFCILKVNNKVFEYCHGTYYGKIGFNNSHARFIDIFWSSKRKSTIDFFDVDECIFFETPSNIPNEIIINNILCYI